MYNSQVVPPFSKKFIVTGWGWFITLLYLWIWSAFLAKDCVDDFQDGDIVAFFDQLPGGLPSVAVWKPVHHICMTHPCWCWASTKSLSTFEFLQVSTSSFLCRFLHAAQGLIWHPAGHSTGFAFSNHLICYFSNSLLKLVIPLYDWCWEIITLKFLVPVWQLDLEFVFSISILQLFPIKCWPLAWFSFGSTDTGLSNTLKDTMVQIQFHRVIGPAILQGIHPFPAD